MAVAVSAASGALGSGALAAGTDPLLRGARLGTLAKVVAPVQGGLVRGDRVRIRVKTGPGVRSFRAWLGSREISRSFSRAGAARVAVVRAGKGSPLELGVNRLYVRVRDGRGRRDFDYVRFVRARPRSSLLRLEPVPVRARGGRVPVRLRLGGGAVGVRAWLNGRRLRGLGSGRVRRLALDGDRGLRFGRNTIRLVGIDERGAFDVERRAVSVGRDHPIPAAGRNRRVKVGDRVGLDARGSTAAHRRSRLGYRWRIVQRPQGSKAKLRRARSARPRLRPDRLGSYRVRLLLSERRTVSARGSAAATHARDDVTLSAGPDPIGLPITVLADPGGDIRLGSTPPTIIPPRGLGVAVWVFDRSDLSFQARLARAFTPDVPGMQALAQYVDGLDSSQLVIIAAPPGKSSSIQVQDPSAVSFLNEALAEIGAPSPVQGSVPNPPPQGFSAVGVPGMPCCEAPINPGLTPAGADGATGINGALSGYLQLDNNNNYTFVSADYVPYNTVAAGTTDTQAVITVAANTYTSQALSPGQTSGFFLLILDAGSLQPVVADTQPVSVDSSLDPSVAANGLQELANRLTSVQGDPSKLVFLQSIGQVQRGDAPSLQSAWNSFASAQSQIGGNGLYLNSLDPALGVRSYSYVGPVPPSNETGSQWSATASAVSTLTGGQLSGLLARNPISQYYPKLSGTVPNAQTDLPTVLFQPPTPWPNRTTTAQRQAMNCIAAALDLTTTPIEANYINENLNFGDLGSKLDDVEFASLSKVAACQSVTDDDFEPAKTQLVTEFDYVGNVWQFIGNLQKPLVADASTVTANLTDITQAINNTIKPPPNNNTLANGEQLISAFMYVGSALPGAGEVLSLDGAMFGLAGELANEASGANELQGDVTVEADSLGDILAGQFQDAYVEIDTIGQMLVSDWGKLQTTFQNETGEWTWTSQTTLDLADAATGSAQRLVYEALFPLVYTLYRFGDQHVSYAGEYSCFGVPLSVGNFYPFANEPEGGNATIIGAGPTTDVWAFGKIDQDFLQQNVSFRDPNGTPPQSLYNSMFVTPVSSRLNAPAIPTQQRFMLDVYDSPPHTITRDELDECLVDGNLPPG